MTIFDDIRIMMIGDPVSDSWKERLRNYMSVAVNLFIVVGFMMTTSNIETIVIWNAPYSYTVLYIGVFMMLLGTIEAMFLHMFIRPCVAINSVIFGFMLLIFGFSATTFNPMAVVVFTGLVMLAESKFKTDIIDYRRAVLFSVLLIGTGILLWNVFPKPRPSEVPLTDYEQSEECCWQLNGRVYTIGRLYSEVNLLTVKGTKRMAEKFANAFEERYNEKMTERAVLDIELLMLVPREVAAKKGDFSASSSMYPEIEYEIDLNRYSSMKRAVDRIEDSMGTEKLCYANSTSVY
jgi:hypothetical protein